MPKLSGTSEFPCDVCGSPDALEAPYTAWYTGGEPLWICRQCGFVYVKHRRSAKAIADWWSEQLYGRHYTARIPAVQARLRYCAEFIDQNIPLQNKLVVDIGAGEGEFLTMLTKDHGARVYGIEPSSANGTLMAALGHPHFVGTIEDYRASAEYTKRKADVVTILWTLENCMSCTSMLDAAYDILDDSGYIVIGTGSRILVPFKKPLHYYIGPEEPQDIHPFRWSANSLRGILAKSSFEVTTVNRYLDSDVLCAVAQKRPRGTKIEWEKDNFLKVADFFTRWHFDSMHYR